MAMLFGILSALSVRGNDDWLDQRQDLGEQPAGRAHRCGHHQDGREVEAVDPAEMRSDLTAATFDDGPCNMPGRCLRCVLGVGAALADILAGAAVVSAPTEVPLCEGDQAFFSSPSASNGMT
ncbi:hypothetical protein ABS772_06405 [Methylorubrum podarium]|uniref:DUF2946 domain-containing protein n=1 Tax=Methylorubrum podarium TaxID=200476 RepID=A0ABV1QJH5_9HYPH